MVRYKEVDERFAANNKCFFLREELGIGKIGSMVTQNPATKGKIFL